MKEDNKYSVVWFEIVGFCNARCPYCTTGSRRFDRARYPARAIDAGDFHRAIVTLLEAGLVYPREALVGLFNWGEPMLHPELAEILRILAEHDLYFALSTNASNFVRLEGEALKNLGELKFSVSGVSQASYDKIHGFRFQNILRNIELFCTSIRREGSQARLVMAYHVYQFNVHEIDAAMRFCSLNSIEFFPYYAFLCDFHQAKTYLDKSISSELLGNIGKDLFMHYVDELIASTPQDYRCPQFGILTIDEGCNVLTCCLLPKDHPEYSIGHLFELSAEDIRERKSSRKVCNECMRSGMSAWIHTPIVPKFARRIDALGTQMCAADR